jgi:hypothetical protein
MPFFSTNFENTNKPSTTHTNMMILLTTGVSEKRIMQNGEKNREKTVLLWVLHKNGCYAMWSFAW